MGACHSLNSKRGKIPMQSQDEMALQQCKAYEQKLSNYVKDLETKEKNAKDKAKVLIRQKQKDRAKFYLKQCKFYRQQAKIAQGKLDMVEDQIINLENAKTRNETYTALVEGKEALQKLQKEINIEELEKVKEDFDNLKEKDKEMGDFLKERGLENEAECEEEINKLTKEIQSEKTNNLVNLPNVPNTQINTNQRANLPQNIALNQKKVILA